MNFLLMFLNFAITLGILYLIYWLVGVVIDRSPFPRKDIIKWVWLAICVIVAVMLLASLAGIAGPIAPFRVFH